MESRTGASGREPRRPSRRGALRPILAVVAVGAVLAVVCSLGPVRTVLRQSFTDMSGPTAQFYLNGSPWVSGEYLEVPLGVIEQNGPSSGSLHVHLWTVDAQGKTVSSAVVPLGYRDGRGVQNVAVTVPVTAQIVWAQVQGTSLSVHYRFEGTALPSISPSPSASGTR